MFDDAIRSKAAEVLAACRAHGIMLATAESCTGGLIAAALTGIPGSSDVVDRGFVTYTNAAKSEMLGVPAALIAAHGAVSEQIARAMADGALAHAGPDTRIGVAVTGVAGPGSDSAAKPAGLVHIATAMRGGDTLHEQHRFGDIGRDAVRRAAVIAALDLVLGQLQAG